MLDAVVSLSVDALKVLNWFVRSEVIGLPVRDARQIVAGSVALRSSIAAFGLKFLRGLVSQLPSLSVDPLLGAVCLRAGTSVNLGKPMGMRLNVEISG